MRGVNRRVLLRSFFLEVLWNYSKRQNVGFVFCIFPALRRVHPEFAELKSAVWRQLDLVNTHPSMGPLLAGITARLEQEQGLPSVVAYRKRVMAALAAQGDRVFWSHVKPMASVCGALFALGLFGSIAGSVAMLFVYNVPNLYMRVTGFSEGWERGLDALQTLKSPGVDRALGRVKEAMALAMGIVAGLAVLGSAGYADVLGSQRSGVAIGTVLTVLGGLGWALLRKNFTITKVSYLLAAMAVVVFYLLDTGLAF